MVVLILFWIIYYHLSHFRSFLWVFLHAVLHRYLKTIQSALQKSLLQERTSFLQENIFFARDFFVVKITNYQWSPLYQHLSLRSLPHSLYDFHAKNPQCSHSTSPFVTYILYSADFYLPWQFVTFDLSFMTSLKDTTPIYIYIYHQYLPTKFYYIICLQQ